MGRLMKEAGIRGASRRRRKAGLTRRDRKARPAPDLVNRNFAVEGPDQLWVADLTYIHTKAGWLYVAVGLDAWSRLVVGWAMETHLRSALVEKALAMAVIRRQPKQVIHLKVSRFRGRFSREAHKRELQAQYERLTPAKLHQRIEDLKDELLDRHRRRSRSTVRAATSGLPSGRSFFEATDDTSLGEAKESLRCHIFAHGTSVRGMSVSMWYHPSTLWVPHDSARIRKNTCEKSPTALDRIWRESPCRNAVGPHRSVTA